MRSICITSKRFKNKWIRIVSDSSSFLIEIFSFEYQGMHYRKFQTTDIGISSFQFNIYCFQNFIEIIATEQYSRCTKYLFFYLLGLDFQIKLVLIDLLEKLVIYLGSIYSELGNSNRLTHKAQFNIRNVTGSSIIDIIVVIALVLIIIKTN